MAQLYVLRHGQTEWSKSGQHTGWTDIPLTETGETQAASLAPALANHDFGLVLSSPLQRARRTAELAGLAIDDFDDDLKEWDYGGYEGMTTAQIREQTGIDDWIIWDYPIPAGNTPGESSDHVAERTQRVLDRLEPVLDAGKDCIVVAHGHVLRILTATWLGLPSRDARLFALEPARLGALGHEHQTRVIDGWNSVTLLDEA